MNAHLPSLSLERRTNPGPTTSRRYDSETPFMQKYKYLTSKMSNLTQDCPQQKVAIKTLLPSKIETNISSMKQRNVNSGMILEKVWLIRTIGDLLSQDNKQINIKRRRLKRGVNNKYKKLTREADKMLNLIKEEGNEVDKKEMKRLRQILK